MVAPAWPTMDGPLPRGSAPAIAGAPGEIAARSGLPYCGQSELGEPAEVGRCFVGAVLSGRPAEAFDLQYGTEGGTSLLITRFAGLGPLITYQQHLDDQGRTGPWFTQLDQLILGTQPGRWSANPIDGTFRDLP